MKWLKVASLVILAIVASPVLLLVKFLDYCSEGWFSVLAKKYLGSDK